MSSGVFLSTNQMRYNQYVLLAAALASRNGFFKQGSSVYVTNNPAYIDADLGALSVYPTKQNGFDALVNHLMTYEGKPLYHFLCDYVLRSGDDMDALSNYLKDITGLGTLTVL
jgi:hypothetical protein